jgi:hypothetical protein
VKLFVNAVAETVGVAAAELVLAADEVVVVLDEFELPHATMKMLAATASNAMEALPFSKCTMISSFFATTPTTQNAGQAVSTGMTRAPHYDRRCERTVNIGLAGVNVREIPAVPNLPPINHSAMNR